MEIIKPIKLKKQGYKWVQAVAGLERRGLLHHHELMNNKIKNYYSYVLDYLIIGSNPILTYILLSKLHDELISGPILNVRKYNIGIILNDEDDSWDYEVFEKKSTWETIGKETKLYTGKSFKDFINNKSSLFFDSDLFNCVYIKDENFDLYSIKYDKPISAYIISIKNKSDMLHLNKKEELSECNARNKYKRELLEYLKLVANKKGKNLKCLHYPNSSNEIINDHKNTYIILANNLWLTSKPKDWIEYSIENYHQSISYKEEKYVTSILKFKKYGDLDKRILGTAKKIAVNKELLEKQSLIDVIDLIKTKSILK